ncbi:hypothetical protein [Parabacteroides sp. ZJ-118]|uniref:hypothetical protein n=1 Tax=Parabacteroides sp. ZJ-118 TaxID=2709398 RepID=UPI0013EA7701|nr:hypothetical protein [Parabacteroides sp. ZJ-118]
MEHETDSSDLASLSQADIVRLSQLAERLDVSKRPTPYQTEIPALSIRLRSNSFINLPPLDRMLLRTEFQL